MICSITAGRSSMKQYLPLKPTKRGFKVWIIADSKNGYFLDLQVYVGSEGEGTEHGLGERVVLGLTEQYRGVHHQLYCDNFFSSPWLFQELLSLQIYACGTVRQTRRGFPQDLRSITLARGEGEVRQSKSLAALVWQDKRPVHVLSTLSQPGETQPVLRRERDGSLVELSCPTAILAYTKYMGGVDLGDQLRKYYSVRLKCRKNYKYIFWFIFYVCITNSFILSKFCNSTSQPTKEDSRLKTFRAHLAESLIGSYTSRQRAGRPRSQGVVEPSPVEATFHSPCHHYSKRCVYCHKMRDPPCRRESVWQCKLCMGEPTLCLTGRVDGSDCWSLWHQV